MAELALALPVIVFGLLGAMDLARAYSQTIAVQNGARVGAESYAIGSTTSAAGVRARVQQEIGNTPGLNAAAASVTVEFPTVSAVNYVKVRVTYQFQTLVSWPLVPTTVTFDRTTLMRLTS